MRLLFETDPSAIKRVVAEYHVEARAIERQIYDICWYMRSMGREEAWSLSYKERETIMKLIEANIKRVNDTHLPLL
jgi:hypothetical protein